MEYCNKKQKVIKNSIEINHCQIGRYECSYVDGGYCYMSPGDLSIGSLMKKKISSSFPLSHYHGITIVIKFDEIPEELSYVLEFLSIDLEYIRTFVCDENRYCVVRDNESIEHIFSELYFVREKRKEGYMKIKVLELLLFLSDLNIEKELSETKYYNRKHVEIIKKVRNFIIKDITKHYTISQLSEYFNISSSTLKMCFKGVYGSTIYSYLRMYRLQTAQKLLLENSKNITEIAECIGYENPNKFSSAFKKEFGVSPKEYRKDTFLDRKMFIRSGEEY
ncbi:MAG: helix-turn-helix transcriptional regulator [Clostridium butyricum]|nr:helix-turn-helix transcriptional regulator [Clostridium butyricum]